MKFFSIETYFPRKINGTSRSIQDAKVQRIDVETVSSGKNFNFPLFLTYSRLICRKLFLNKNEICKRPQSLGCCMSASSIMAVGLSKYEITS
jgi:hypothetical protein